MRKFIIAAVLAAVTVPMAPALADRDRGHGWAIVAMAGTTSAMAASMIAAIIAMIAVARITGRATVIIPTAVMMAAG